MEHIVMFERGYDCMKFKCIHGSDTCIPGGGGSHGVHGMEIRFVSKGDLGAVQFLLYTGWLPQHIAKSSIGSSYIMDWGNGLQTMAADLGYHSMTPHYEGQTVSSDTCEFCDGQPCYYDGSGLNANDAMYALVNGGDEALWQFLDAYYNCVFNGGEYPSPAEYPADVRGGN